MCVEQASDGAASGVPGHEERAAAASRVFLKEGAQAGGDGADHFAGDREEARVAEITGVVLGWCVSWYSCGEVER